MSWIRGKQDAAYEALVEKAKTQDLSRAERKALRGLGASRTSRPLRDSAGAVGSRAVDGLARVAGAAASPGGGVAKAVNSRLGALPVLRRLPLPVVAVAAGGVLLPAITDVGPSAKKTVATGPDAFHSLSNSEALEHAYTTGTTPMSDSFNSFVAHRKTAQVKTANIGAMRGASGPRQLGNFIAGASGAADDMLRKLLYSRKTVDVAGMKPDQLDMIARADNVRRVMRDGTTEYMQEELSPARLMGAAGIGGAAILGSDMLDSDPMAPASYQAKKQFFGLGDRIEADETFAKNFVGQAGKNTANMLNTLMTNAVNGGAQAIKGIPEAAVNKHKALNIINTDPALQEATDAQKSMLTRAFDTMQTVAPSIAGDEFAVTNYLRDALFMDNGPDYNTIANLAKADRDMGQYAGPLAPVKAAK